MYIHRCVEARLTADVDHPPGARAVQSIGMLGCDSRGRFGHPAYKNTYLSKYMSEAAVTLKEYVRSAAASASSLSRMSGNLSERGI
jgi:hypothetical protein